MTAPHFGAMPDQQFGVVRCISVAALAVYLLSLWTQGRGARCSVRKGGGMSSDFDEVAIATQHVIVR